jgi:hypothetical protein
MSGYYALRRASQSSPSGRSSADVVGRHVAPDTALDPLTCWRGSGAVLTGETSTTGASWARPGRCGAGGRRVLAAAYADLRLLAGAASPKVIPLRQLTACQLDLG